jgi:hypothetical protein
MVFRVMGLSGSQLAAAAVAGVGVFLVLRWYVRREADEVIRRLIVAGFVAKIAGTGAYYYVIANVYGSGDVDHYVRVGRTLAPMIRAGTMPDHASQTGTRFMEFLTGVVFAVVGTGEFVGYLVFSMLAFVGMLAFLKALQLAAPDLNHRRYAALLLLLPTMLFWTSTIGKDAWLVFTLGMASYGLARVLKRRPLGFALTALSLMGMGAVRPHMGALFAFTAAAAYLLKMTDRTVKRNPAAWAVGLILVLGGVSYAALNFSENQGRGETDEGASTIDQVRADTEEILDRTGEQTGRGGSEFEGRPVEGPGDFVHALITVPFRPFFFEAHNRQAQLISLESLAPARHLPLRDPRAQPLLADAGSSDALPRFRVGLHRRVHHRLLERRELRDPHPSTIAADAFPPGAPRAPSTARPRQRGRTSPTGPSRRCQPLPSSSKCPRPA